MLSKVSIDTLVLWNEFSFGLDSNHYSCQSPHVWLEEK